MRKAIFALATVGLFSGCNTTGTESVSSERIDLPADYRQQIVARAKAELFDPYSVRDAGIAPTPIASGTAITGTSAIICVRFNAKNRIGAYTGMKLTSYVFQAGQLTMTDQQYSALSCSSAAFEPFPELEGGAASAATKRT